MLLLSIALVPVAEGVTVTMEVEVATWPFESVVVNWISLVVCGRLVEVEVGVVEVEVSEVVGTEEVVLVSEVVVGRDEVEVVVGVSVVLVSEVEVVVVVSGVEVVVVSTEVVVVVALVSVVEVVGSAVVEVVLGDAVGGRGRYRGAGQERRGRRDDDGDARV